MNIKVNPGLWSSFDGSIQTFIERELDSERDGQAEQAQDAARKSAEALGRLVNILAQRGLLTAQDIVQIARGYTSADAVLSDTPEMR